MRKLMLILVGLVVFSADGYAQRTRQYTADVVKVDTLKANKDGTITIEGVIVGKIDSAIHVDTVATVGGVRDLLDSLSALTDSLQLRMPTVALLDSLGDKATISALTDTAATKSTISALNDSVGDKATISALDDTAAKHMTLADMGDTLNAHRTTDTLIVIHPLPGGFAAYLFPGDSVSVLDTMIVTPGDSFIASKRFTYDGNEAGKKSVYLYVPIGIPVEIDSLLDVALFFRDDIDDTTKARVELSVLNVAGDTTGSHPGKPNESTIPDSILVLGPSPSGGWSQWDQVILEIKVTVDKTQVVDLTEIRLRMTYFED